MAIHELFSGKLIPTAYNAGVTRDVRPAKYWSDIVLKIVVALVIAYLAAHHLLPDSG
jgi:hypothetical protein